MSNSFFFSPSQSDLARYQAYQRSEFGLNVNVDDALASMRADWDDTSGTVDIGYWYHPDPNYDWGTYTPRTIVASNGATDASVGKVTDPLDETPTIIYQPPEGTNWPEGYGQVVANMGGILSVSPVQGAGDDQGNFLVTYSNGSEELSFDPLAATTTEAVADQAAIDKAKAKADADAAALAEEYRLQEEERIRKEKAAAAAEEQRIADEQLAAAEAQKAADAAQQARLDAEIELAAWTPYATGTDETRYQNTQTDEDISAEHYQELVDAHDRAVAVAEENARADAQLKEAAATDRASAREAAANPIGVTAPVVNGETYEWFYDANNELTIHWTDIQNRSIPGLGSLPRHAPTEAQINRGEPGTLMHTPTIDGYSWTSDPEKWTEAQLSLLQGRPIREGGNWIKADGVLNSFLDQTFVIPSLSVIGMPDEIQKQIEGTMGGGQLKLIDLLGVMFFSGSDDYLERVAWWDLHERGEGIPEELWVKIFRPSYYENPITIDEIDFLRNWLSNVHTAEIDRLSQAGKLNTGEYDGEEYRRKVEEARDVEPRVQPAMQPPAGSTNADGSPKPIAGGDGIPAVNPYTLPFNTTTLSVSMDDTISLFMNAGKGLEAGTPDWLSGLVNTLQTNIGLPETFDLGSHIGFGADAATIAEGQAAIARIETAEEALGALDVDVANLVNDDIPGLEAKLNAVSEWLGTVEVPDFDVQAVLDQIEGIQTSLDAISTGSAQVSLEGLQTEIDQASGAVTRLNIAVSASVTSLSTKVGITKGQIDTIITNLSGVGLSETLTKQINALISEDPNISDIEGLKSKLGELQTEGGEYLGDLVDRIADTSREVSKINAVLDGLKVPTDLQNAITNMLYMQGSDLNVLIDNLKTLNINPTLELQIENRLAETQTLQSALTSLNVNPGLSNSIHRLTVGDLLKLQNALASENLKLPDTLQQSIIDRTSEISALKTALGKLPDVSNELSNDIIRLMGGAHIYDTTEYGGGGLLGAITRAVSDLAVPPAFMERLTTEIDKVTTLQKSLDALPLNTSLNTLHIELFGQQMAVDALNTQVKGLKVNDAFSGTVSTLLADSGIIEATLLKLQVPLAVRMQVDQFVREGGTLDELKASLLELEVGDNLQDSIIEATSKIALLAQKLTALDVGTQDRWEWTKDGQPVFIKGEGPPLGQLLTDLTVLLSDNVAVSDVAKLKGVLSGMGDSWDILHVDLQNKLAKSLADANLLEIALGGIDLEDGIMTELSNLLSDEPDISAVANLKEKLLDLKVNPNLAQQIEDRLTQAGSLRDTLKDLNVAGLQQEINLTQYEADSLKNVLDLLKVRPELKGEIDAAAVKAGDLDGLVSALSVNSKLNGEFLQANIKVSALTSALGKLSISNLSPGLEGQFTAAFIGASDLSRVLTGLKIDSELDGILSGHEQEAIKLDSLLDNLSDKIDTNLASDIRGMVSEVGDLGIALTKLQLPIPLTQDILLADAQASRLKFNLAALDVPDNLRQQIVDETIRVGDLSTALFDLNLDELNPGLTQQIILRTSQVESFSGLMSRLGVPSGLSGQIKAGIDLGQNLDSVLRKLNVDPLLSGKLSTEYVNVNRLDKLLLGLDLPGHLAISIADQTTKAGNLFDALKVLRLDDKLIDDIGLRLEGVLRLESKINQLNDIGALGTLQTDLEKVMRDGGDLDEILELLPTLEVPTALSGLLTNRLVQARNLEASLGVLALRGTTISDTVRDKLQENLDILGSAVDENSLIYILENLGVPGSLSEQLGFMMDDARDLEEALDFAKTLGFNVTKDIKDAVRDNLDKLIGVGVDFGDDAATDSLIGRLGEIGLDPTILPGLEIALANIQQIDEILTPLRRRLADDIVDPIKDALKAITGDGDPTKSLKTQLDNLGFDTDTVDEITKLWEDVKKLKGIMEGVGVRTEVQTQVSTLLSMGEDLAAVLTNLGVEDEDKQAILDAARGVEGLTENLSQAETIFDRLAEEVPSKIGELTTSLETFGETVSDVSEQVTEAAATGQAALSEYEELTALIMSRLEDFEAPVLGADLYRALSRPQMAEIEESLQKELTKIIGEIGFDPERYRLSQTDTIDERFDMARERLARQFGITPAGQMQGQAMRHWEILESNRIIELNDLDVEIMDRTRDVQLETLNAYTNTLASISQSTIQQQELAQRSSEFTEEMRFKLKDFGLNEMQVEAAVRQIDSAILNRTRELSNEIAATWAALTGEIGFAPGVVDASMLGIDLEILDIPFLPGATPGERDAIFASPEVEAIRLSFAALVGRDPTDSEIETLINGNSVDVDSMPTQQAREFAVTVMMQNMERVAKYAAIAAEHEFDSAQFEDAKTRLDKEWNLKTLQVGEEFGLDQDMFRIAKFYLDNKVNDIFFNTELSDAEKANQIDAETEKIAMDYFPDNFSEFFQANDQFDILYGNSRNQIALAKTLDAKKFEMAIRQANAQETRMLNAWASMISGVEVTANVQEDKDEGATIRKGLPLPLGHVDKFIREVIPHEIIEGYWDTGSFFDASAYFVEIATGVEKDKMNVLLQNFSHGMQKLIYPDRQMIFTLGRVLEQLMVNPDNPNPINYRGIKADWFSKLDGESKQALMGMINGSNISPERTEGSSWLSSLGQAIGIAGGAYVGAAVSGGNPAVIAAAAQAGGNVGASVG